MKQIYFLRRTDGTGPIKIGCSDAPKCRAKQLGSDYRTSFEILATAPGDYMLERNLHLKFADLREAPLGMPERASPIGGVTEWFSADPELLAFIEEVKLSGAIDLDVSECRERLFAARYMAGETLEQIAVDFGITRERVRQVLRATGIPSLGYRPSTGPVSVASMRADEVIRMVKQGATVVEIVRAIGGSSVGVRRFLRDNGIPENRAKAGPPFRPDTFERAHAVADDYAAGLRVVEIAAKHGICVPDIYRFLRLAGATPARLRKRRHSATSRLAVAA